jgi:hypothetical protein
VADEALHHGFVDVEARPEAVKVEDKAEIG